MNCCTAPSARADVVGVTAMETNWAAVTFSVAVELRLPHKLALWHVAVTDMPPGAIAVARPDVSTFARVTSDVLQRTAAPRSCVVPSLKVPMAENCVVVPADRVLMLGVTAMPVTVAAVTVRPVVPDFPFKVALSDTAPGAIAVTTPVDGLTMATAVFAEAQATCDVTSWWLSSE